MIIHNDTQDTLGT